VVVVSASAGALTPIRTLVRGLPTNLPAAVVIAQHCSSTLLPELLNAETRMPVVRASSGLRLQSGVIYVCPGGRHVVVNPDATLSVSAREHVNFVRPNGDWLFVSAAASFRDRTVGIVLSGLLDDGARGAHAIHDAGGLMIAQDPATCLYPDMPRAAIAHGAIDLIVAPEEMPLVLQHRLMGVDMQRCRAEWEAPFATQAAPPS